MTESTDNFHIILATEEAGVRFSQNCTVSPILPGDNLQIHQMANQTNELAATLHVYLDAIDRFHLYQQSDDRHYELMPKQLWFDQNLGDRPTAKPALAGVA